MGNRKQNPNTVPPSTPQGPESNQMLVSPVHRDDPYPAERAHAKTGEGSPVAAHATGLPAPERNAAKEALDEGDGGPLLEKAGQTKGKKDGREQHHP